MSARLSTPITEQRVIDANIKLASFTSKFRSFAEPEAANSPSLSSVDKSHRLSSEQIEEIRQQNDDLSHLVDILPNGVVVLDNKGMVRQANKFAISLLGEPLEGEKWRSCV